MSELGLGRAPEVQPVRSKNRPAVRANRVKHMLLGDSVKETIEKMETYPHALEIQETCCTRLMHLAEGGEFLCFESTSEML